MSTFGNINVTLSGVTGITNGTYSIPFLEDSYEINSFYEWYIEIGPHFIDCYNANNITSWENEIAIGHISNGVAYFVAWDNTDYLFGIRALTTKTGTGSAIVYWPPTIAISPTPITRTRNIKTYLNKFMWEVPE